MSGGVAESLLLLLLLPLFVCTKWKRMTTAANSAPTFTTSTSSSRRPPSPPPPHRPMGFWQPVTGPTPIRCTLTLILLLRYPLRCLLSPNCKRGSEGGPGSTVPRNKLLPQGRSLRRRPLQPLLSLPLLRRNLPIPFL